MKKIVGVILLMFSFGASADTTINEEFFRLVLPGKWLLIEKSKDENLWVYQSKSGKEQISVSILPYSKTPSHSEKKQFLEDYINIRKDRELAITKYAAKIFNEKIKEYPTGYGYSYDMDGPGNRKVSNKAISNSFGIGNFYYESLGLSQKEFENSKGNIFKQIGLLDV